MGSATCAFYYTHQSPAQSKKPLEDGCCATPLLPGTQTFMSRFFNRHRQFDINLTSKTGCNGWASGHRSSRQAWSPVKHHQKSHNLGWLPCHYFTTRHANTVMSRFQQAPPPWHGDRLQQVRQHTPLLPWSPLKHATADSCDDVNVSGVGSILLAHHKTWTSSCTQLPPSTCMRKPPL